MKSSFCDTGSCVEVAYSCDSNACVEVTVGTSDVYVWDSKEPGVQLRFTPDEWEAFLKGAKAGEFDITSPVIDAEEVSQEPAEQLTIKT